jgi:DNA-binding NarL/FixJ family response regulator
MLSWTEARLCLPIEKFEVVRTPPGVAGLVSSCRNSSPCFALAPAALVQEALSAGLSEVLGAGRLVRLLVLHDTMNPAVLETLLLAGCSGFLPAQPSPSVCQRALRAVQAGEIWGSRRAISGALQRLLAERNAPSLSTREDEILTMLAENKSNRQIAEELSISGETVRWHLRRLHRKLGTTDRPTILAYALEHKHTSTSAKGGVGPASVTITGRSTKSTSGRVV